MSPPDREPAGPRPLVEADVPALNQVFADAFTDRYRRDGMVGVRVPRLNPDVWRYALRDAGAGAVAWVNADRQIVAFNIAHRSGTEGWMGPLAVRTDAQGQGIGRRVVQTAVDWLREQGVRTIGLETMPRTVDNIGFYSRLGFLPGHLTVTVVGAARPPAGPPPRLLSDASADQRETLVHDLVACLGREAGGYDFSNEMTLTQDFGLGDTIVMADDQVRGFALWHSAPLVEGRVAEELRLLKLYADSPSTLEALIVGVERCARDRGVRNVAIRCQTAYPDAYSMLIRRGYRVRWTDLRMTLAGYESVATRPGTVLFSNWEI